MTATLTTAAHSTSACDVEGLREACGRLLATISTRDPDDRRWLPTGPLVHNAAMLLRKAVGVPTVGASADAPPIVCERDLSRAAHRLLARDVRVVDDGAATEFVQLALKITLAFS